jgi:ferritin-like metal-binding protein YciE
VKQPTNTGMNRTGMGMSPMDSKKLMEASRTFGPSVAEDGLRIANVRRDFVSRAEPLGAVPPPSTARGMAKTMVDTLAGKKPNVFIDKLGARLAFERTGTRLYEAVLMKYDTSQSGDLGPTREDLQKIRLDEWRHAELIRNMMERLGADPTAQTPSADVTGVASMGLLQVITDPRTTLSQCLDALLIAELADTASWEMLVDMATELGQDKLVPDLQNALQQEEQHLVQVRGWLAELTMADAWREDTQEMS